MTNLKPSKNWPTANVLAEYRFWMRKWVIPHSSIPAEIDHPAPSHHKQRLLTNVARTSPAQEPPTIAAIAAGRKPTALETAEQPATRKPPNAPL